MNTHVKTITDTLACAGLAAELLPGNRISITPAGRLTDDLRALIRENKASIIRELQAANQPNITLGTRRPDDLTPALMAASVALDRQIEAAGYSLAVPDDRPVPQTTTIVALPKDNPPPRKKKLDHFHVDSAWRVLSEAYYQHHFKCPQCQAAGRGSRYGQRCGVGASLWIKYATRGQHENH